MSSPFDSNTPAPFDALAIPPAAMEKGGFEILRAAVIDDGLHVTLRPVFEDTRLWGRVLADIARQVAQAYAHQGRAGAPDVIANIRAGFEADLDAPPDMHTEVTPLA